MTSSVCSPAGSVTRSSPFSGRAGRSSSSIVTFWTSASFGILRTSGCSRLLRAVATSRTRSSLRPGVSSIATLSIVSVWPSTPCGWLSATVSVSPGQGRYSGAKTPSSMRETGARFAAAQDQTGLQWSCQTSDQGRPSGRGSRISFVCSSVDCQTVSLSSPPRLTATSPFSTTRLARVGASPGSSGTRTAIGAPSGVARRTCVVTVQVTPKPSVRVTSSHGA